MDTTAITAFKEALAGAIPGDAGLKIGDEFRYFSLSLLFIILLAGSVVTHTISSLHPTLSNSFIWPKSGGLIVTAGSYVSKKVENPMIAKRLIEVYVDPSRCVSKELLSCISDNLDKI